MRTPMTPEQVAARRAVRAYLEAVESAAPRPGRRRTPESITNRLTAIDAERTGASPLRRLDLAQERIDLRTELDNFASADAQAVAEPDFIAHAATYGQWKQISYPAWRAVGVSADVLRAARIGRSNLTRRVP